MIVWNKGKENRKLKEGIKKMRKKLFKGKGNNKVRIVKKEV